MKKDILEFTDELKNLGMILCEEKDNTISRYFKIAGLKIGYTGPDNLIHPSLLDYECSKCDFSQHWIITLYKHVDNFNGELIIRHNEMEVFKCNTYYILRFPSLKYVKECKISLNGQENEIFCFPQTELKKDETIDEIFQVLRVCFLYSAQLNNMFAIHSSSILYKDKAWLFSGSSGTGKSTHTSMWYKLLSTPILNGDLNLCRLEDNDVYVMGMPWCGTSGIYTTNKNKLGGVILLEQSKNNIITPLIDSQKILLLSKRCISPTWTAEMLDMNLAFFDNIINLIDVVHLKCNKENDAVYTIKQHIDVTLR